MADIEILTNSRDIAEHCGRLAPRGKIKVRTVGDWKSIKPSNANRYVVSRVRDVSRDLGRNVAYRDARFVLFEDQYPLQGLAEKFSAIGAPKRIHFVSGSGKSAFLKRLISTLGQTETVSRILDAWWDDDTLIVLSPSYERLTVPRSAIAPFRGATDEQLRAFEIDTNGAYVYWPSLDVHLGWEQFQQAVDPHARLRAQQKSHEFNRRYGAAIRETRERHKLRQSDIARLTERQVGRIERGECRATRSALTKLAVAHKMTISNYLDKLASIL